MDVPRTSGLLVKDLPFFVLQRMGLRLVDEGDPLTEAGLSAKPGAEKRREVTNDPLINYPIQTLQAGHYLDGPLGYYQGGVFVDGTDYNRISQILTDELGRDFTYLHPEVIDDRCSVSEGILTMSNTVNTEHFSTIILPGMKAISKVSTSKVERSVCIFHGEVSQRAISFSGGFVPLCSLLLPGCPRSRSLCLLYHHDAWNKRRLLRQ